MYQTKDLFPLQIELVQNKVDMAVTNSIDRVLQQIGEFKSEVRAQIADLRTEMHAIKTEVKEEIHELRHEMRDRFVSLETRVTAVEVKLGIVNETRRAIQTRFIDYCFKAGWLGLGITLSYLLLQFHITIS